MRKILKNILLFSCILVSAGSFSAETSLLDNKNYKLTNIDISSSFYKDYVENNKNKYQVFFFYGCSHCQKEFLNLENDSKIKKVEYVPLIINDSDATVTAAKHFYAAKILNVDSEFSKIYFNVINNKRQYITDDVAIQVFKSLGLDEKIVKNVLDSNLVKEKIKYASEMNKFYKVTYVPFFVKDKVYVF